MTEQLKESPKKIRSEGRQISIAVDPRLQSSHGLGLENDLENDYQFFRTLVKNNIFQLTNVTDQRAISTWLHRCDEEHDKSLKCGMIKLMLVSLQHPRGNMKLFRHSAPKNLPYLVNNPNHLRELVDDMLTNFDSDSDGNDEVPRRRRCHRRTVCTNTAAVSSDMTSIATAFADDRSVQAFYARSDRTVDTWHLPLSFRFPVHSRSASRWEKALTTDCPLTARATDSTRTVKKHAKKDWDLPVFLPDDGKPWKTPKWNTSESDLSPMEQKCRELMSEQMSPVDNEFRWYEHSRLDGSFRPMAEFCIDKNVCDQGKNQSELDEQAISVANKVYPKNVRILVDPRLITEVIGKDPTDRRESRRRR